MRLYFILFNFMVALFLVQGAVAADGRCGSNLHWHLKKNGTLIISGEGRMTDFGGGNTPWRPELVKYIQLGDGITYIGKNAFSGTKITSLTLPASLIGIGENAFFKCRQLASVELKFGIESIERKAFADCVALGKINFPSTLRVIGDKAFQNCKSLSKISLPMRLNSLGTDAFAKCSALSDFTEMPDFITTANCSRYGITPTQVREYYEQATNASNMALTSVTSNATRHPVQTKRNVSSTTEDYGMSDVDRDIPVRPQTNTNTFAVIISNENYSNMSVVPFSINDGTSFNAYCRMVLGIPDNNIFFYKDASYGEMKGALTRIKDIDNAYDGHINVIFYYSGHGAPDESSKEAFLIPVDAYKAVKDVCLPMDELYNTLGALKSRSVKVFLDACFSGANRDNTMLAKARAVAVAPKKSLLSGNTVVISSSSDSQTSWQYNDQQHGLFTYCLLKKLKETKGDVLMGELSEYISENVGRMSVTLNQQSQTPSASASPAVTRVWKSWPIL